MIFIRLLTPPEQVANLNVDSIIDQISETLQLDMLKLASEIVGNQIPRYFPAGAPNIAATVRAMPVEREGSLIRATVEAGGPRTTKTTLKSGAAVDYAAVQHEGVAHSYEILPIIASALRFEVAHPLAGFVANVVFAHKVMHPGLQPRPYMTSGLEALREEIIGDLQSTVTRALAA